MLDLILRNARLPDGGDPVDVAVKDGRIAELRPGIEGPAAEALDAGGHLVTPPFVDSHFHMDSTLTYGRPRVNESGTLLEGIALWAELKPDLTAEAIKDRALRLCRLSIARGTLAVRSHVDISDGRLLAVEALLEVKRALAPHLDLQLVAFPQDGFLRLPEARENLLRALDLGVGCRRHPALRADPGRGRGVRAPALRDRRRARPAGGHATATRPTIPTRATSRAWPARPGAWASRGGSPART